MKRNNAPTWDTCVFCKEYIEDGRSISGYTGISTDWMTEDGDFGCDYNPITCEDGCGGHLALYDLTGLYVAAEAFPGEKLEYE